MEKDIPVQKNILILSVKFGEMSFPSSENQKKWKAVFVFISNGDKLSKNENATKLVFLFCHPLSNHMDLNVTENVGNIGPAKHAVGSVCPKWFCCYGKLFLFQLDQEYFCTINVFLVWLFSCDSY